MHNATFMTRICAATLGLALGPAILTRASDDIHLRFAQSQIEKYAKLEATIVIDREYDRPFDPCEVEVDLLITGPGGQSLVQPAFFCQDYERQDRVRDGKTIAWYYPVGSGSWKARFTPSEMGSYTLQARLRDRRRQRTSDPVQIRCVPSERKGFVRADPTVPRFLAFSEGQVFFAIGQNLAFVGETQYVNVPKAEAIFAQLATNGANFLRIWTCCDDWAIAVESPKSAWTRSWTRESPVVTWPRTARPTSRKCVQLKGPDGTSVTVSPSHPVALRPNTSYVLAGQFLADGATRFRLQVGEQTWELPAESASTSGWQMFSERFATGANDYWLGRTSLSLIGEGTVWLDALSLQEAGGGAELLWEADVNRPIRGTYNQLDCFMLDRLVEAAERNRIYLMLCLLTRNLYMDNLSTDGSLAYRVATEDAKKLMRYAVARWGYSTSLAAWEYFNEMDPGKPTDRFYAEMGAYLDRIDIHHHLKTTSTWHPSPRDCRLAALDVAQVHHYLRPREGDFKNEVQAIVDKVEFLREHAPNKPALIGEFGLATEKWGLSDYMKRDTEGIHVHNSLWASAFSGTSGTALLWWWEQLDIQQAYRHYRPLAAYLTDVSFTGLRPADISSSDDHLTVLGFQGNDSAYLWFFNENATWWKLVAEKRQPETIGGAAVEIRGLLPSSYDVQWWDTDKGKTQRIDEITTDDGVLHLTVPSFSHDIACKIRTR
ncbi:MAG: DUF5060 domain-containing protein [Phycisphaerales bacterium]|nr:MAG: DUF5060 domain-containing protein [Phycisphaerales bacterium]